MKNVTTLALALALVTGASATVLTVDTASARGWDNEQGERWGNKRDGRGDFRKSRHGNKGARGPMMMMEQFDTDKDQVLTKDELTAGLSKKITDNDTDGDGSVSLEEFKAEWMKMTQDRMVRAFQRMDRDGSGKVTAEELTGPASMMFDRMDRNNDGKINAEDRPDRRSDRRMGKMGGRFMPNPPAPAPAPEAQ